MGKRVDRTRWVLSHWKIGVHLILRTKRFGVDNRWWSQFDSMFGYPLWRVVGRVILIYPLIREYRRVKARTIGAHLLPGDIREMLWGSEA